MISYDAQASEISAPKTNTQRIAPLIVELPTSEELIQRTGIIWLSDIDGTANDQSLPENERLESVGPARQVVTRVQSWGIPFGLISSRTLPEVVRYQQALGCVGGAIIEDGLGIEVPEYADLQTLRAQMTQSMHLVEHDGHSLLVFDTPGAMERIGAFLQTVEELSGQKLVSSLTQTPEDVAELQRIAGHGSLEDAKRSAVRFASAYVPKPTQKQRDFLHEQSRVTPGIRIFDDPHGNVIHILSGHANKGTALAWINDHPSLFFPKGTMVDRVYCIVSGNHTNDIPLMEAAYQRGGMGIFVAGPEPDKYFLSDLNRLPPRTIITSAVAGEGLVEALPRVTNSLVQDLGIQLTS